jgi:class 3 adenylate cyclase
VTAAWERAESDTVLTTVLFTDVVGSTEKAAELGDARWVELVGRHHALVRRQLDQFRGRELDTAGDGFFATSTALPVRSAAPARLPSLCASSDSRFALASTPVSAR